MSECYGCLSNSGVTLSLNTGAQHIPVCEDRNPTRDNLQSSYRNNFLHGSVEGEGERQGQNPHMDSACDSTVGKGGQGTLFGGLWCGTGKKVLSGRDLQPEARHPKHFLGRCVDRWSGSTI